jgi:hypothetical protein
VSHGLGSAFGISSTEDTELTKVRKAIRSAFLRVRGDLAATDAMRSDSDLGNLRVRMDPVPASDPSCAPCPPWSCEFRDLASILIPCRSYPCRLAISDSVGIREVVTSGGVSHVLPRAPVETLISTIPRSETSRQSSRWRDWTACLLRRLEVRSVRPEIAARAPRRRIHPRG